MLSEIRFAARSLFRQPGFTLVVVLTAALGIGATTATFSVVHTVVLRPLPYEEPERLVRVLNRNSFPDIEDWIEQNRTFAGFGGYNGWSSDLVSDRTPERLSGAIVTGDLFPLLGVSPTLGRFIGPDDNIEGGPHVMVLSDRFWRGRLGGRADVIGETLTLSGNPTTIVGVMPSTFSLPGVDADYWVPHRVVSPDTASARGVHFLVSVGRLAEEASLEQAQADMDAIATRLEALYPDENTGRRFVLEPWRTQLSSDSRPALLMLFGAVTMVLLLACANVAALLMARTAKRHREIALRAALGASRPRVVRQLLVESMLLAMIGGVFGVALASAILKVIAVLGPADVPRLNEAGLDPVVLGFSLVTSIATGLVFGLTPAAQTRSVSLIDAMKDRIGGGSTHKARGAIIVSEIAIAVVLLVGAGLLFKSLYRLQNVDPGFEQEQLVTMDVSLPIPEFRAIEKRIAFFDAVIERLELLPGVEGVAMTTDLPFGRGSITHNTVVDGQTFVEGTEPEIAYRGVNTEYFRVMGIPLVEGRPFTRAERDGALPVAIVNETFVREHIPDGSPLRKRFRWARRDEVRWMTIVGVVGDIKPSGLDGTELPAAYVPFRQEQDWWRNWMSIAVRAGSDGDALVRPIAAAIADVNPSIPVANIETMARLIASSSTERRFHAIVLTSFAAGALFLAAIGVYGLLSFLVTERTAELGVRLALGASRTRVLSLVVRHGLTLTLFGLAIGAIAALALARAFESLLFQVDATDPATFVAIALVLLTVAGVASFIPAYRASHVDPLSSIRYE